MPVPLDELEKANGVYRATPDVGGQQQAGWSDLGGAAMDSTEAGLYGVGEALGIPGARRRRIENQNESQTTREWAEPQLGIAGSWDEAKGVGGTARYLGGQIVNMAPQVAATVGAGLATGGLGAGAVGYGFALSDTLQNQREQAGDTDLLSASAAAVPYAAVDVMTGGEGKLLRSAGVKGLRGAGTESVEKAGTYNLLGRASEAATDYADNLTGVKGVAARTGLNFAKTGAEEAAGETFQETMNQAARMGVDPQATFTSGDALERYRESAIVGGLVGGGIGGATGGWRRSAGHEAPAGREDRLGAEQTTGASVLGDKSEVATRQMPNESILPAQTGKIVEDVIKGPAEAAIAAKQEEGTVEAQEAQRVEAQEALDMRERRAKDEAINQRGTAAGVDMNKHGLLYTTLEEAGLSKEVFDKAVDYLASGQSDKISEVKKAVEAFTRQRAEAQQQELQTKAAASAAKEQEGKLANTQALLGGIKNAKGQPISGLAKSRLMMLLGLDEDGTPVGDRYTIEEVAEIESGVNDTAKPVSKQAIDGMLKQYNLDEQNINELYERVHGTGQTQQVVTGADEDVSLEAPETARGPSDTDQSGDLDAGVVGDEEMGETGSMRSVASIKQNVAVEQAKKQQRNAAFNSLKGGSFNAEQRAAIEAARKADNPALLQAGTLFSDAERKAFEIMFEHGDATATAARRPAVQAEIARRKGVLTEHEKQVRERQALANMAEREREEQARVEAEAQKEGDLADANERLEEDARTLRMHLMDTNKVKQARLIGESLADAKDAWDQLYKDHIGEKDPNDHLPQWSELSPREQSAFVRTIDYQNWESQDAEHVAQGKIASRAYELSDESRERRQGETDREAKRAKAAAPETQAMVKEALAQSEAAAAKKLTDEAAQRKAAAAAKKKEKADGKKSQAGGAKAAEPVQAEGAQGERGRPSEPAGQEVQRGGPATAGKEVPEGGARGAADATAGAPHGPGPVRGADGEAAPASGAEGDAGLVGGVRPTILPYMGDRAQTDDDTDEEGSGLLLSIERLNTARHESPAPLTVTASAGTQVEGGAPRRPSVTRVVRSGKRKLESGKLTPEQFAAQASAALDAADAARAAKGPGQRLRGADRIMEVLLAARRNGELDAEGVEMALWFIRQNPQAVGNLALSVRQARPEEAGASGHYDPVSRIVTLMKGSLNTETAVHEILHHVERMMPAPMQNAIRRAWTQSIARAYKAALNAGNVDLARYYKLLTDYHFDGGDPKVLEEALDMMHAGHVGYEHYQHFNPSEFWAVNGSRIVEGRFGVSGSILGRIKQYLREFVQKARAVLGLQSDAAIIRALDSLAKADGTFTTGTMLQDQPGVHFMYAGEQTADQEQKDQLQRYEWMKAGGATPAELRLATGWFRSPLDHELRYEFSDADAEFTSLRPPERMAVASYSEEPTTYRLEEVLDHPALYEAYPGAKDILVTRQASNNDGGQRVQGWFNPDHNVVNITPYARNALSTLVHELQHWVQTKEGFAVGGSPEEVTRAQSPEQRVRLYERAKAEMAAPDYQSLLDPADREQLEQLLDGKTDPDPDALAQYAAGTEAMLRAYQHIAGEIEARDTQARLGLSAAERKTTAPLASEAKKIVMKDVVRVREPAATGLLMNVERPVTERLSTFDAAVAKSAAALPPKHARYVKSYANTFRGAIKKIERTFTFTEDIARQALKGIPSVRRYVEAMQRSGVARAQRVAQVAAVRDRFAALPLGERTKVNDFLHQSTMSGKWGYQPAHIKEDAVDKDTERAFKALTAPAQQVVRDVFDHGRSDLLAMKAAVEASASAEYDATIKQFEDAGDTERAEDTRKKKADVLKQYGRLMGMNENAPYSPLKRFGNFVVYGKSLAYLTAEAAGDTSTMEHLQNDPAHYTMEMTETRGEAVVRAEELNAQFGDSGYVTEHFEKDATYDSFGTAQMMAGFTRLQRQAGDAGDKVSAATQAELRRMLTDLHYSMMAEHSARQSERRRKGISGADRDMMRSFTTKGQANANFIALLQNNGEAQSALAQMRRETHTPGDVNGTTRDERADHYNELVKRHAMTTDWRPTPVVDRLLQASSYWALLSSPASWLVNATQTMAISVPVMAGRHGAYQSARAATRAYKEMTGPLAKLWKRDGLTTEEILEIVPKDVRAEIEKLIKSGHISGDNNFDLKSWQSSSTDNPALKTAAKIHNRLGDVMTAVELLNRLTTATAAIRMERARQPGTDGTAYAARMIYETHGDYSGFNAPAWMRTPTGRVLGQFRKFALIQLGMYGRLINQAFNKNATDANGERLSGEERWAAGKSLGWLMGSMGFWGGALGMPFAQLAGGLIGAIFGDDDEPDNPELTMRRLIGNEQIADLLLQGVPAALGVNLSGRIGAGNLGNPLPFGKLALDRKSMQENVAAALGPLVGTSINMLDGLHTTMTGDVVKGMEQMLPKGFANASKGLRLATQGMTQKNGDLVMAPDEIGLWDAALQGIGLPTTKITDRSFRANAAYESSQFFKGRVSELKREYTRAYADGDAQAMAEVRENWSNLNAHQKADGYKPSALSDLLKAPQEKAKREKATAGGVQFRSREEGAIRQLAEL